MSCFEWDEFPLQIQSMAEPGMRRRIDQRDGEEVAVDIDERSVETTSCVP